MGLRALAALLPALVLAGAAAPHPAAAAPELVVNGSFEEYDVGFFDTFFAIPGWTTTFGPGIEIQDHAAGDPLDGAQHVELDSHASSGMEQPLATVPGATYNLTFWVSPRPGAGGPDNVLQVSWDGVALATIAAGGGGAQTAWLQYSYSVVATSGATALAFADVGVSNSFGAYLDLVSVTQVETIYNVCLLYDPLKPKKAGSVVPIKLQLCDANYNNVSDPSLVLNAINVANVDPTVGSAPVEDAGQANPDYNFRYDPDLAGYIFNLDTNGLWSGTWQVQFTVNGGSQVYAANFDIK